MTKGGPKADLLGMRIRLLGAVTREMLKEGTPAAFRLGARLARELGFPLAKDGKADGKRGKAVPYADAFIVAGLGVFSRRIKSAEGDIDKAAEAATDAAEFVLHRPYEGVSFDGSDETRTRIRNAMRALMEQTSPARWTRETFAIDLVRAAYIACGGDRLAARRIARSEHI